MKNFWDIALVDLVLFFGILTQPAISSPKNSKLGANVYEIARLCQDEFAEEQDIEMFKVCYPNETLLQRN